MLQLVGGRRASWAVLCVAALFGSLFAVAVLPAGAARGVADAASDYNTACSGNAANDSGFTDVGSSHAHFAAINCLAHYRVTVGTGDGKFSPGASVTRRQMALFMQRAAGVAGVTLADAVSQGFTDVASESQAIQDAINQVAAAGILTGSAGMFRPADAVTRAEMAVAIINLLAQNGASDFVERGSGKTITIKDQDGNTRVPDDAFADVTTTQPRAVDDAVSQLYELEIAKGTSATMFSPTADVTRAQMAAFITRALAFTSARPVGVSIAPLGGDYEVSVRDENFEPVVNARVDYFFMLGDASDAFNADGTCDTTIVQSRNDANPTTTECQIDSSDATTDGLGDVTITISGITPSTDDPLTVWAWTGDIGDKVQQGTTQLAQYVVTGLTVPPSAFTVKRSAPTQFTRLGSTVTVTIQLVDNATALNNVSQAGYQFDVAVEARQASSPMSITTVPDENSPLILRRVISVKTDRSGQASFSVGGVQDGTIDPDANSDSYDVWAGWDVEYVAPQVGPQPTFAPTPVSPGDHYHESVVFSDNPAELTTVTASPVGLFNRASDAGSGVIAYIDARATDQYGSPVAGQTMQLSEASSNLGVTLATSTAASRYTGRSGSVRLSYVRDNADPVQGTIHAQATDNEGNLISNMKSEAVTVIWVDDPDASEAAKSADAYAILTADLATNTIVVDGDTSASIVPWAVSFDSDDRFIGVNGPTDMAGFVKAIADDLQKVATGVQTSLSLKLRWRFRSAIKNTPVLWTLSE